MIEFTTTRYQERQVAFKPEILFGIIVVSGTGILSNIILSESNVNTLVFRYRCSLDILMTLKS